MIKLKDNGSKIEVWKISHGRNRDMSQNDHELLLENNLVSIGHGDDQRQGEYFRKIPKGAYFYLVRNAHIVLWGQFDSDVTSEPPEGFAKINWVARKIKIIKLKSPGIPSSEIEVDFRTRLWGPSGRSTVFQVPSNQLEKFEKDILKPVFGLSLLNESESPEGDITEGIESMTNSLNSILYGPPGTGKTYNTVIKALKIIKDSNIDALEILKEIKIDESDDPKYLEHLIISSEYKDQKALFDMYKKYGLIEFVTFHQSFSYEDFVEGIRAKTSDDGKIRYVVEDGVFKALANKAKNDPNNPYVLIIDEINRGNISRIFGELITLIEPSKRLGAKEAITPYSKEDQGFGVPKNLYIIGTMNTADRSLALMDTALRRRFDFIEMMPNLDLLTDLRVHEVDIKEMLEKINMRIEALYDREHTIGHAFFMELSDKSKIKDLKNIFKNKILPLLEEYFFEDWEKISKVLGNSGIYEKQDFTNLGFEYSGSTFRKNAAALEQPNTYINIYKNPTNTQ